MKMRCLLLFLLTLEALAGASLADRIETAAAASVAAQRGFWGVQVVDAETGDPVYEHNAAKLFVPASNVKLFTSAVALARLGPAHRFRTRIHASRPPDAGGVIRGDLRFLGGGDPTLSARKVPYEAGPVRGDPLGPLNKIAGAIVTMGVRRVEGNVIGDDTAYVSEPYPEGWGQEDAAWQYGAPVSALALHDNSFKISIYAGKPAGVPARLFLQPAVEYYTIHNRVRTSASGDSRVFVEWSPDFRELHLWGAVRANAPRAKLLAIREPARYAAWALAAALRKRGVEIRGGIEVRKRWLHEVEHPQRAPAPPPEPEDTLLYERESPPLDQILQIVNKLSQNLHAELVLREVGRVTRNVGSRAAGLAELDAFLREAGVASSSYKFADASGLSRLNLVSPSALTRLLRFMYLSEERDVWLELLAIGGEDGTLDYRFRSPATRGRVFAKTGTLTGASALSGYVSAVSGRTLAFSIMINNHNTRSRPARQFIDAVVAELVKE